MKIPRFAVAGCATLLLIGSGCEGGNLANPEGPTACEAGSTIRRYVNLTQATMDYLISELDTEEVRTSYEFASSSSWGYRYDTYGLCSGLAQEMKAITPEGMFDSPPNTATGHLSGSYRIIWDLIRANLTAREEVCEEGPEFQTDPSGNRIVVTNPCIRKVEKTVYLEGFEEGDALAQAMDTLTEQVAWICDYSGISVKQNQLDDLKRARAEIDTEILGNGVALFLALECAEEEAFARLFGLPSGDSGSRVSSRAGSSSPRALRAGSIKPPTGNVNAAI